MATPRLLAWAILVALLSIPVRASVAGDVYELRRNFRVGVGWNPQATVVDGTGRLAYVAVPRGVFSVALGARSSVTEVAALKNVRGLALASERRRLYATLADGSVAVVDLDTRKVTRSPNASPRPTGKIAVEPKTGVVAVSADDGRALHLINAATAAVEFAIPLSTPVDVVSAANGRVYALLRDNRIQVIDAAMRQVAATWQIPDLSEAQPAMTVDPARNRLFIGAGSEIVMIDGSTGGVLSRLNTNWKVLSLGFDAANGLVVGTSSLAGSAGTLTVAREQPEGTLTTVQHVDMPSGAGGLHMDAATGLFVVTASGERVDSRLTTSIQSPTLPAGPRATATGTGHFLILLYEYAGS